ncbi:MAG: hypothetical protein PHH22_02945 [Clostridia bacterium]|nr:hypothetical protein [Clostridia bacterium]
MSKKKIKPRERYRKIDFQTDEPIEVKCKMKIVINMLDKIEVELVDKYLNEYKVNPKEIDEYYIKDNENKKILSKSIINQEQKNIDIDKNLLTYDIILAIDTSYDLINNEKKAFTAIAVIQKIGLKETTNIKEFCLKETTNIKEFCLKETMNIFEWNVIEIDKPENLMYAYGISNLEKFILKNKLNVKVAVVIDSDFDNISSFNKRTIAIFDNYMLPNNFFIFYSSTDSGNCLSNQLLKRCDIEAKNALKEYKNGII